MFISGPEIQEASRHKYSHCKSRRHKTTAADNNSTDSRQKAAEEQDLGWLAFFDGYRNKTPTTALAVLKKIQKHKMGMGQRYRSLYKQQYSSSKRCS